MTLDHRPILALRDSQRYFRPDRRFFCPDPGDAAHHPRTFFQLDQNDIVRLLRRARVDLGRHIDRAFAACLNPFERLPFRPGQARRKEGFSACGIALQKDASFGKGSAPMSFGASVISHMGELGRQQGYVNSGSGA